MSSLTFDFCMFPWTRTSFFLTLGTAVRKVWRLSIALLSSTVLWPTLTLRASLLLNMQMFPALQTRTQTHTHTHNSVCVMNIIQIQRSHTQSARHANSSCCLLCSCQITHHYAVQKHTWAHTHTHTHRIITVVTKALQYRVLLRQWMEDVCFWYIFPPHLPQQRQHAKKKPTMGIRMMYTMPMAIQTRKPTLYTRTWAHTWNDTYYLRQLQLKRHKI